MNLDNFYQDHWREIEEDRLQRYNELFRKWPGQDALLAPMALTEGMKVVDFGCGPGFLTMEMARKVGDTGKAYGLDLNARFISDATDRASASDLPQARFICTDGSSIPLPANSVDRVFCKNVLEYVPDALATMKQQHDVLVSGGMVQILDSDFGFIIVEPWGKKRTDAFFEAASAAFKEPCIGRKLVGLLNQAGFVDIDVNISNMIDTTGSIKPVLINMASYINKFNSMDKAVVDAMMGELDEALSSGDYFVVLPQFVVSARK